MIPAPVDFDRDIPLSELLRAVPCGRLRTALDVACQGCWRIIDMDRETVLCGQKSYNSPEVALPFYVDIDILGWLTVPADYHHAAQAIVPWLELLLAGACRYQMVADLHLAAVHADFEALQAEHEALHVSEERYRQLAGELEQRVQEQVSAIERAQRELFQSAQMASVGSLAAGVAHEINNPIGFMRSNLSTGANYLEQLSAILHAFRQGDVTTAQALWRQTDTEFLLSDFAALLSESAAGAERIARIVARLNGFAAVDRRVGPADLNEAVRTATDLLHEQLPLGVNLVIDVQPLPPLTCDLAQMNQVLFAILRNAQQAVGTSGTIAVSTRIAGGRIRVAVRDNGCGMDDDIRGRIFDPFFTTRDVGEGTGLGLTVANDIVRAHDGRIEVESVVGVGSTFTVCLPVMQQAVPEQDQLP